nr:PREDICTED: myelin regulatory factor-like protein isoform X2 [Lepisosteus oculatus]
MSSSAAVLVLQCGATRGQQCADTPHSESNSVLGFTQGTEHLWPLAVSPFQEISYHFRIAQSEVTCDSQPEEEAATPLFSDYHFLFWRSCA